MADLLSDLGRKDAAIATYRGVVDIARAGDLERDVEQLEDATAESVASRALDAIAKLDSLFAERVEDVSREVSASARAAAAAYLEAGCPDNAAHVLSTASHVLASPRDLLAERDRVVRDEGGRWRRRCRLPVTTELENWRQIGAWSGENGVLKIATEGTGLIELRRDLPDTYRIEIAARATRMGKGGWMGVAFGIGSDGVWDSLGAYVNGAVTVERCSKEFVQLLRLPDVPATAVKDLDLAVDVNGDVASFWVQGKEVGRLELGARALRGRVGLACSDATVEFHDAVLVLR